MVAKGALRILAEATTLWPCLAPVQITVRLTTADAGKITRVQSDSRGFFRIPDVPAGEYCFKATAVGWQSVLGRIVVSKKAEPANRVTFVMPLGV